MSIELAKGKWTLETSENFDEYMKTIGVGMATRVIVNKLKPDIEISITGDKWTIKTISTFKNTESIFKINEPFKDTTPDGRNVDVLCTVQGNTLTRTETGTVNTVTTRAFTEKNQTVVLEAKGVKCTRLYQRKN